MIKREQIGKKEVKDILSKIESLVKIKEIPKKGNFGRIKLDKYNIITLNKEPIFIEFKDKMIPCIKIIEEVLKNKVKVDMGALRFLINGADVMAPGIVEYDKTIKENDVVFVFDEKHNKIICVGIALVDFENLSEKGKVIKNIHYVGDKIWNSELY
jgi:PUA domain protein